MSRQLLALSIGPVQDFIAAARKTRDLWFGSYLLSELSKAAAKTLQDSHPDVKLIFPAPQNPEDLLPDSPLSVANKILADLSSEQDAAKLAEQAQNAVKARWLDFASDAYRIARRKEIEVDDNIWESQIGDVIEFYAAWVLLSVEGYQAARRQVERLLAGRKSLREFQPAVGFEVSKSSLDGARESVFRKEGSLLPKSLPLVEIKKNEQLDAVGLVKRLAGERNFPSVTQIAVAPWLRGVMASEDGKLLLNQLEQIINENSYLRNRIVAVESDSFRYDGTLLYPSRWTLMAQELDLEETVRNEINDLLKKLHDISTPSPYYAILVADGDRMGAIISQLGSMNRHRHFSFQLSGFASRASEIVTKHDGALVYSGGDDVLAFLPVNRCLQAARELHDSFEDLMKEFPLSNGGTPTLSVGIAVGHHLEPLDLLLENARAAEKTAKHPNRDGLAVHFHTRAGDTIRLRADWKERPDEDIIRWAELLQREEISSKAPYDLRELVRFYKCWPQETLPSDLLQADCLRILKKKRPKEKQLSEKLLEGLLQKIKDLASLDTLVQTLLLARHFAGSFRQSKEIHKAEHNPGGDARYDHSEDRSS